ncbi:MAG: PTS sugar transporter subunit IIA [Lysobacter sp.]
MPLNDLLSVGRIAIVSDPGDRAAVIDAAARLLANPPHDDSRDGSQDAIRDSLQLRERLASTAIGHGVAIPHGRVDFVDDSRGAFLRLSEPVDFGAADGQPVDLVLAMVVPEHSTVKHLQQLAELAEYFSDDGFRTRLRNAGDMAELNRCLLGPVAGLDVA